MTNPRRKLSKSACEKWMACPASYDYHYNQYIRPIRTGSPLMFGLGIDAALNEVLLGTQVDPMSAYKAAVAKFELGLVTPSKNDYDSELLAEADRAALLVELKPYGYTGDDIDQLVSALMGKLQTGQPMSERQFQALDLIHRRVFEIKAVLMIDAYKREVMPHITKVYNVQKQSGPGFLDATVEWAGRGKVILDNKTAGRPYAEDSVMYSAQLAMYAAEEGIELAAYVVLLKNVKKNREKVCSECGHKATGSHKTCNAKATAPRTYTRLIKAFNLDTQQDDQFEQTFTVKVGDRCDGEWNVTISPEAEIQIVHGSITREAMAVAAELQREVQRAVDAKIFPCNVANCHSQFGKACEYKNLKWNGSMEGLVKLEKKK